MLALFTRLVAGELKSEDFKVDPQDNGLVSTSEVHSNHFESEPYILPMHSELHENKSSMDNLHSDALKDERNITACDLDFHGYEGGKDMEKALEHQAQLIGRYEAMERAQREWEEKFRENNNSTPVCFSNTYLIQMIKEMELYFLLVVFSPFFSLLVGSSGLNKSILVFTWPNKIVLAFVITGCLLSLTY